MTGIIDYLKVRQLGLLVAMGFIVVDAATKLWALQAAAAGKLPIVIHENVMALVLGFNRGMSFSLLSEGTHSPILLSAVAVAASAWFIHWLGETQDKLHQIGLGLILSGALGNLIDRLQHGAVVDFLLPVWDGTPWFPAFNVADACISVGLGVILLHWVLQTFNAKKNSGTKPAKGKK